MSGAGLWPSVWLGGLRACAEAEALEAGKKSFRERVMPSPDVFKVGDRFIEAADGAQKEFEKLVDETQDLDGLNNPTAAGEANKMDGNPDIFKKDMKALEEAQQYAKAYRAKWPG
ncbi:MAG: hypothetical protein R3C68_17375 [Myxococcota bacterium]